MDVVPVVVTDVLEVIAEPDTRLEMLLEVGKTTAERRAPRVDDPRVRQDQVDQSDVEEIAGHLVDEMRFVEPPVGARLHDVPFTNCCELPARQPCDGLWIRRRLARDLTQTELERKAWDI